MDALHIPRSVPGNRPSHAGTNAGAGTNARAVSDAPEEQPDSMADDDDSAYADDGGTFRSVHAAHHSLHTTLIVIVAQRKSLHEGRRYIFLIMTCAQY